MKVHTKLLKGGEVHIEVESTDTIATYKEKLAGEKGESYGYSDAKVIFSGKMLKDTDTFEGVNFKETDFLVVMGGKNNSQKAQPQATSSSSSQPAPTKESSTSKPESSGPAQHEFPESTITQLCEMGYPREQVVDALKAAFGNADRAVEYLSSGNIPHSQPEETQPMDSSSDDAKPSTAPSTTPSGSQPSGSTSGALAGLAQNPHFRQLRAVVQSKPELFPSLMQQMAQLNPELIQLINDNVEEFYQLINDTSDAEAMQMQGAPQPGGQGGRPQLNLSPEDEQAVQRLADMGFDYVMAAQAYMAFDKNEMLAANYLMDQGRDD